jgi:hypothetical protein
MVLAAHWVIPIAHHCLRVQGLAEYRRDEALLFVGGWLGGRLEDLLEGVQVLLHALFEKAGGEAAEAGGGTG